ncbi:MAG: hypothetical protein OEM15_04460 [Myxococcales bacterium]|nr:hypothetical protein [Myxococcales bacterium]
MIAFLILGLIACDDSNQSVDAPDELGPFAVGHEQLTAVDAAREDRSILVDLWYPVDDDQVQDGPLTFYPLAGPTIGLESKVAMDDVPVSGRENQTFLVFSHGYQGINLQSIELMEALASHGFIVASPEHTGNAQASPTDTFDEAAANRVPDVSFLIDWMVARNRDPEDAFYQRIDEESFGVVGNSFGASTAVGMAAGWAGAPADRRVTAIAPISVVIDGEMQLDDRPSPFAGFSQQQLAGVVVPVMLIGGTEDVNVPIGNHAIAFEQMVNAPRVYEVDVIGANHFHFAAVCTFGQLLLDLGIEQESWPLFMADDLIEPYNATCSEDVFPIAEASRLQNLYVVSFFRRHMLDDVGYDQYLTTRFADTEPAIAFSVK